MKHRHAWRVIWSNFRYGLVTTKHVYECLSCGELGYDA